MCPGPYAAHAPVRGPVHMSARLAQAARSGGSRAGNIKGVGGLAKACPPVSGDADGTGSTRLSADRQRKSLLLHVFCGKAVWILPKYRGGIQETALYTVKKSTVPGSASRFDTIRAVASAAFEPSERDHGQQTAPLLAQRAQRRREALGRGAGQQRVSAHGAAARCCCGEGE